MANYQNQKASSQLSGGNAAYIEALYEQYLDAPESVSPQWRSYFDDIRGGQGGEKPRLPVQERFEALAQLPPLAGDGADSEAIRKQVAVLALISGYRARGHQVADLCPIHLRDRREVPDVDYRWHGLTDADLDSSFNTGTLFTGDMKLRDIIAYLEKAYKHHIGAEFSHIHNTDERRWLQRRLEQAAQGYGFSAARKKELLNTLVAADGLEKYLHKRFVGQKRFSLEGGDGLIPLLDNVIQRLGKNGSKEVGIAMAHRGRLNVLINILGKRPEDLFNEFEGKYTPMEGRSGDVKYHMGFSSSVDTEGGAVGLSLAYNPSHLEFVNPVVQGSMRARLERVQQAQHAESVYSISNYAVPIQIHGDAAFAGQGIIMETLQLSQVRGYRVGGSLHIIVNNQIGFTTSNPNDTRSTEFCTDIAKMIQAPIIHVNGDDPEAVAFAARMAVEYRTLFKRDIFIDLISYRRHGHNEADEPLATQPMMYSIIKKHPTPRKVYEDRLVSEGVINQDEAIAMMNNYRDALDQGECVVPEWREMDMAAVDWLQYLNYDWTAPYENQFPQDRFLTLAKRVAEYPENVKAHSRVEKIYNDRKEMAAGNKPFDWGMAETMAYATLLDEGTHVRISGEDAGRGTFFHRHAVVHNQNDGTGFVPLTHLHANQGRFQVWDSVLSEEAVLAFEYGFATTDPKTLTIWEAQFGDFANGAQIVIDQFISSGEQKWGRMCGLVMLLPHGYEGQGPEHSSARVERYLQLCAEQNIQVCIPSTPAQVYHMLRRQAIRKMRRPLVAITPKSLLRHPLAISSLKELTEGTFQNAIGEIDAIEPSQVKRVVMCSGKVFYDLIEERRKKVQTDVAIVRIEQLYPFPYEEVAKILEPYTHVTDFVWCQEEPQNQGAWYCSKHNFEYVIPEGAKLSYAGRPASAAPAVGYASLHNKQQRELIEQALTL